MAVEAVIQHRVKDYDTWRKEYDDFAGARDQGGVTHANVYRAHDDPSNLLVIHGFGTVDEAEEFLASAELREAMQRAGVEGPPRIEIYQDA